MTPRRTGSGRCCRVTLTRTLIDRHRRRVLTKLTVLSTLVEAELRLPVNVLRGAGARCCDAVP